MASNKKIIVFGVVCIIIILVSTTTLLNEPLDESHLSDEVTAVEDDDDIVYSSSDQAEDSDLMVIYNKGVPVIKDGNLVYSGKTGDSNSNLRLTFHGVGFFDIDVNKDGSWVAEIPIERLPDFYMTTHLSFTNGYGEEKRLNIKLDRDSNPLEVPKKTVPLSIGWLDGIEKTEWALTDPYLKEKLCDESGKCDYEKYHLGSVKGGEFSDYQLYLVTNIMPDGDGDFRVGRFLLSPDGSTLIGLRQQGYSYLLPLSGNNFNLKYDPPFMHRDDLYVPLLEPLPNYVLPKENKLYAIKNVGRLDSAIPPKDYNDLKIKGYTSDGIKIYADNRFYALYIERKDKTLSPYHYEIPFLKYDDERIYFYTHMIDGLLDIRWSDGTKNQNKYILSKEIGPYKSNYLNIVGDIDVTSADFYIAGYTSSDEPVYAEKSADDPLKTIYWVTPHYDVVKMRRCEETCLYSTYY